MLNGSNANSAITINSGGTLAGTGTGGATTVNSGALIAPGGSSVGTLAVSTLTLQGGGGYTFTISNVAGSPGTNWDLINVGGGSGAVALNSTSANKFTIYLNGTPTGWSDSGTYAWNIISSSNVTGFSADQFAFDLTSFNGASTPTGTFYMTQSASALVLNYGILGDSVWSGGSANWSTGFSPAVTTNSNIFFTGAAGGNATNDIAVATLSSIGTITFNSTAGAYTLNATTGAAGVSGGTALTLTGSVVNNSSANQSLNLNLAINTNTVVDAASGNIAIGGVLSGTGILTKNGTGTLTLSGANTYTGTTTVNAGNLNLSGGSAITDNGVVSLANASGVGLTVTTSETIGSLQGGGTTGGNVSITSGQTLTINETSTITFSGAIAGSGGLTKNGSGTLTLSGANSYSGSTTIGQGTLAISKDVTIGGLVFGSSAASTSVGTLDLSSANATFGSLTVQTNSTSNNTITIGTGRTLTTTGNVGIGLASPSANINTRLNVTGSGGTWNVTNSGGLFQVGLTTNTNFSDTTNLDLSGLGTFTANLGSTGNFTIGGRSQSNSGGPATVTLASAVNTITTGTLGIGEIAGTSNGNITLNLGANATNTINANTILLGVNSTGRGSGVLKFTGAGNGTLQIRAANGSGAAALTSVATATTGSAINSLFDVTGHSADILFSTVDLVNVSAPTGAYSSTFSFDSGNLTATTFNIGTRTGGTSTSNQSATVNIGSASNLTNNASLGTVQIARMAGTNGTMSGTLNITGSNTAVSITSLMLGNATAVGGTSNATLNISGGTVTLGGNISVGSTTGAVNSAITLNGGTLNMGGNNIGGTAQVGTLNFQSGSLLNVGQINNGATALVKSTSGTLTLNGANTFSGGVTLNQGQLNINSSTALGTGTLTINGGTIDNTRGSAVTLSNNNAQNWNADFTFAGTNDLNLGAGAVTMNASRTVTVNSGTLTVGGSISGSGYGLTKAGAGTLNLSGNNTYTGATTVNSGTLVASAANALGNTSQVVMNNAGSLLVTAADSINDSSAINLNGGRIAVSGTFSENVGLLTLSANSTIDFSGFVGTLRFSGINSWASTATLAIWNWSRKNRIRNRLRHLPELQQSGLRHRHNHHG